MLLVTLKIVNSAMQATSANLLHRFRVALALVLLISGMSRAAHQKNDDGEPLFSGEGNPRCVSD